MTMGLKGILLLVTILLQKGSRAIDTFKDIGNQNLSQVEGVACEPLSRDKMPAR